MTNNKIALSNEGIFPIIYDEYGDLLQDIPATGLQTAGTIQGEGSLIGVPSIFVRLASCNLRCIWNLPDGTISKCDTPYASFDVQGVQNVTIDYIFQIIKNNIGKMNHIVITGGEPFIQKTPLAILLDKIKNELGLHITIETNGTIFDEYVSKNVDLFSISPKLKNSNPTEEKLNVLNIKSSGPINSHKDKRYNIISLQQFIDFSNSNNKDFQLKFVVGREEDEQEIIEDYVNVLKNIKPYNIMLMPLGANKDELDKTIPLTLAMAIRNGWRYTSRIHIDIFGSKKGV